MEISNNDNDENGSIQDTVDNTDSDQTSFLVSGINPIFHLQKLSEQLEKEKWTILDFCATAMVEEGYVEILKSSLSNTESVLQSAGEYIEEFTKTIQGIYETMTAVTDHLCKKLKEELNTELPDVDQWSVKEAETFKRESECQEIVSNATLKVSEVALLAAEAERNSSKMAALAEEVHIRINQTDKALSMVEEQVSKSKADVDKNEEISNHKEDSENRNQKELEEEERRKTEKQKKFEQQELLAREREKQEKADKEEMQRKQKETIDTRNWEDFVFTKDEDNQHDDVMCVLRAPPDGFHREEVECRTLSQIHCNFQLGEQQQLVSELLHVRRLQRTQMSHPLVVLLPHYAPRGVYGREVAVMVSRDGKSWKNIPTKDVALPNFKTRMAEVYLDELVHMSFAVITRVKIDRQTVTSRGVKLYSSVDPRTTLVIPKRAFRLPQDLALKIQPIDQQTLSSVKDSTEGSQAILATSHLVFLDGLCNNLKPLTLWLPNPGVRKPKSTRPQTVPPNERRDSTKPNLPERSHSTMSNIKEDINGPQSLHLVMKQADGEWVYKEDPDFQTSKELLAFTVQDRVERLWVIRALGEPPQSILIEAAQNLDEILRTVKVKVIVRQKSSDMAHVYITCCSSESCADILENLAQEGFDEGPEPSADLGISEGQVIEIRFRGNLTVDDQGGDSDWPVQVVYNSHLPTCQHTLFVKEIDQFAQHSLPYYRGHLQFYIVNTKDHPVEDETPSESTTDLTDTSPDENLLVELPVELPKPAYQHQKVQRAPIVLKEKGPLTRDYFEEVCRYMGDEWRQLASTLGISRARIQAIIRQHLTAESCAPMVRDMLESWFKNRPKNSDKVRELYWALKDAGREDLAMELYQKNLSHQAEVRQYEEGEKMKKAIRITTGCAKLNTAWKKFAKSLRVSDEDVEIVDNIPSASVREKCRQMLLRWVEEKQEKATRKLLVKTLRKYQYSDVADDIIRFVGI